MKGFTLLGLSSASERNLNSKHPFDQIIDVLKDAPKELDTFKEVEEALNNVYTKDEINALLAGYTPGEGGSLSLTDYLKKTEAAGIYQPKGNYLTEHQSLEGYAKTSQIPSTAGFIKMSDVEAKNYLTSQALTDYAKKTDIPDTSNFITEHQSLENYALKADIPTSLPASDVPDWAKAETKPTYSAEEVGALPANTEIPEAQVQSDWNAEEGMGAILNKPELFTKDEVQGLYSILEERISALENNTPSDTPQVSYKGYFTIVPGETTKEWKANLAGNLNFTELPEGGAEVNSDSESGMIAVLYNKWIPRFDAYDDGAQSWQEAETSLNSAYSEGKEINGKNYILWYNTGATVDANTKFKIILP